MRGWRIRSGLIAAAIGFSASALSAEPARVQIAVAAPQTGLQARLGLGVHTAAEIVVAEINARGGVNGLPIELLLVEDPCASSDGGRAAVALARAQVDAVIGFPCRSSGLAAAVFGKAGQLAILTAPLPRPVTGPLSGETVFHMPVAAQGQGGVIGARLAAAGPSAHIAIVRDKTAQAVAMAQAIDVALRSAGRMPVVVEAITGGDKSFAAMVGRMQALGVTHVALVAFPVEGALIARELVAANAEIEMIGPDFLVAEATPSLAGAGLSRMRVVRPHLDPYGAGPEGRTLMDKLTSQGIEASREALIVATAIEAWAVAAAQARSVAPMAVAAVLSAGVETRFGRVGFDARRMSVVPYWGVFRWDGERVVGE